MLLVILNIYQMKLKILLKLDSVLLLFWKNYYMEIHQCF